MFYFVYKPPSRNRTMPSLRAWALFSAAVPVGTPSNSTSGFEKWFIGGPYSNVSTSSAGRWGGRGDGGEVGSGGGEGGRRGETYRKWSGSARKLQLVR